jgi:HEAT repeats
VAGQELQPTMPDPFPPTNPGGLNNSGDANKASLDSASTPEPKPSESDVVNALVAVEKATKDEASQIPPVARDVAPPEAWAVGKGPVVIFIVIGFAVLLGFSLLLVRSVERGSKELSNIASTRVIDGRSHGGGNSHGNARQRTGHAIDAALQKRAEELLARVATGDAAAADRVLSESSDWTGKTERTPSTNQFITSALNSANPPVREAAVQAQLALDGVPRNENGLAMLEQQVGNPAQRPWALWTLGALGNRGVDPVHTAKIIGSYLTDPDVTVRAASVDALSLVGTDETLPMLLDRFRNDPSPVVQERAACDLAQSGMYTHEQRMTAASTLVGWVDDSLLTTQQRGWAVQALTDIAGRNLGTNSEAWRSWYESSR